MSGTPVFSIPKPIVDFLESLVSAYVIGASGSALANITTDNWKLLVVASLIGGCNMVISAARRGLIQPTP